MPGGSATIVPKWHDDPWAASKAHSLRGNGSGGCGTCPILVAAAVAAADTDAAVAAPAYIAAAAATVYVVAQA